MSFHKDLTGTDIHVIHYATFADATSRTAATYASTDVGKVVKQTDNNTYWLVTATTPTFAQVGGGGGGGGALQWRAGVSNPAPVEDIEFNQTAKFFTAGDGQSLYALLKVPASYAAGSPINLDLDFYSPSTSNNWQFTLTSGLIRKGTDAAGSTTNQNVSTPTATTNGATANKLVQVTFLISDSTGKINSVSVSAGDEIELELKRSASDTDVNDIRFRNDSTSARFT